MTLTLIGVNHKTAPIELRERIAIGRDELADATRALAAWSEIETGLSPEHVHEGAGLGIKNAQRI